MTRHAERLVALADAQDAVYGNKARGLARLGRHHAVPAGVVISADVADLVLRDLLRPNERIRSLVESEVAPDPSALAAIEARLVAAPLPAEVEALLDEAYEQLAPGAEHGLAVRSSSTLEDLGDASAAGMNASVLGVRTREGLRAAYVRCVSSLHAPRAVSYLRARGKGGDAGMAVIVQIMVSPDFAGVAFSRHPLTGDDDEVLIELTPGLGAGVADGSLDPDVFRVDKATLALRDRVHGGRHLGDVRQHAPDGLAQRIARLAVKLEGELGRAVDVEVAAHGEVLYVLQARAITTGARPRQKTRGARDRSRFVWSNINVGESLPGVATPFTWSVLSSFSSLGFRRAFGALGCTVPDDAELVGEFRGRIYLNMSEFMRVLSQVPFVDPRVISALGGGDFAERLEKVEPEGRAAFLARFPIAGARFLRESVVVDTRASEFAVQFEAERKRIEGIDLRMLSAPALDRTLLDVERLLDELGSVMLTVYGSLLASVLLLDGWLHLRVGGDAERVLRDLLTGLADIESAAPGRMLALVGRGLDRDPAARAYLLATPPAELRLEQLPAGPTRIALGALLERYGHRGFREAEIAAPRWREDPRALLEALRLDARQVEGGAPERSQRIASARLAGVRRFEAGVPLPMRPLSQALLGRVQRLVALRERLRSDVVAVLGAFRTVVLEVSRRIAVREPEAGTDAGFFLTQDEVHAYLAGKLRGVGLLVGRRRARFHRDAALPEPPSTFVGHPPDEDAIAASSGALRGLAASGGVGEGPARIVRSPADLAAFEAGDVLVVPSCDVGWSPVFLHAAAVVTDLGGPLSHAAIVLRELGVPAVVNVVDATRRVVTGERLQVDGDAGVVVRVQERS